MVFQPEIQKDHVRLGIPYLLKRLIDIRGCGEHPESRLRVDHRRDPLAQQPVIVNEHQ